MGGVAPRGKMSDTGRPYGTMQCAGGLDWIDRPQRGHNMLAHGDAVGSLGHLHLASVKTTTMSSCVGWAVPTMFLPHHGICTMPNCRPRADLREAATQSPSQHPRHSHGLMNVGPQKRPKEHPRRCHGLLCVTPPGSITTSVDRASAIAPYGAASE
jgi:hypothetical protein